MGERASACILARDTLTHGSMHAPPHAPMHPPPHAPMHVVLAMQGSPLAAAAAAGSLAEAARSEGGWGESRVDRADATSQPKGFSHAASSEENSFSYAGA